MGKTLSLIIASLKSFMRDWKSVLLLMISPLLIIFLIFISFHPDGLQRIPVGVISEDSLRVSSDTTAGLNSKNEFIIPRFMVEVQQFLKITNYYKLHYCLDDLQRQKVYLCIEFIESKQDEASVNLASYFRKKYGEVVKVGNKILKLYSFKELHLDMNNLDIDADLYIFLSKHVSKAGVDSLTVHPIGNFGENKFGGFENEVVMTNAFWMKKYFQNLKSKKLDIEVTMEATHHGPYVEKPSMFVEIGSNEVAWKNKDYAEIVIETLIETFNNAENMVIPVFCIGGTHYCNSFLKIQDMEVYAISHICPKYGLESLNEELIRDVLRKSGSKTIIALDYDGLGKEKQRVLSLLNEMNLEFVKTKFFRR